MDYMKAEMDIMNQLCHPRLVRLWDAHEAKSSLTLAIDMYPFHRMCFGSSNNSIFEQNEFIIIFVLKLAVLSCCN